MAVCSICRLLSVERTVQAHALTQAAHFDETCLLQVQQGEKESVEDEIRSVDSYS